MKLRVFISLGLIAALLTVVTMASAPRLHERLHPNAGQHECAVTLIASGNCEHNAAPQIVPRLRHAPNSPAFLPKRFQFVVAAVSSSVQEHAPPAAR